MYAKAIEKSFNRKCGNVSVTMSAQASCWERCPFHGNGCYGEGGPLGWQTAKLNGAVRGASHIDIARAEAEAIDRLSGRRPLRLHVVGDCRDDEAARIVASAAERYWQRGGRPVWTYCHAWTQVARESWGRVSVLASCETPEQVRQAFARGYATALVVPTFKDTKAYDIDGVRILPCPEMTGKVNDCTHCRLCWNDNVLRKAGITIAFAAHGRGARRVMCFLNGSI